MKVKLLILGILFCIIAGGYYLFTIYDNRFPFGRMWETPAVRSHEEPVAYMAPGRVPWDGGEAQYRFISGEKLMSPVSVHDPEAVKKGGELYGIYCNQCHGVNHDGNGSVGQSFAPLPGNLRSARVQSRPEGTLFKEISYGIPDGRQPPLAATITVRDRWLIIAYLKSLGTIGD